MDKVSKAAKAKGADGDPVAAADAGRRVATIERAADVLFLFTADRSTLGVTEIASELGISKAVVHRILTSLKERDLVASDAITRKYSLGPAVLVLAGRYRDQLSVRPYALDAMERLSATTHETATLSIRSGWQRTYVEQVTPPLEVKMTVKLGAHYPLYAGASSKAFLAFLPDAEQEAYLNSTELSAITAATVTTITTLRKELRKIRSQGFAVSLGERQAGAASVAAPIMEDEEPVAVISVCGPLERFRPRIDEIASLVLDETRSISARLGQVF